MKVIHYQHGSPGHTVCNKGHNIPLSRITTDPLLVTCKDCSRIAGLQIVMQPVPRHEQLAHTPRGMEGAIGEILPPVLNPGLVGGWPA